MPPPLFSRLPDLADDSLGVRVWYFDALATVVDQTTGDTMTSELASFLSEQIQRGVLRRRWVADGKLVRYLHEWSSCHHYDLDARNALIAWGRAATPGSSGTLLKMPEDASPFLRIAASTAASLIRMSGGKMTLVSDLQPLLAELRASETH